MLRVTACDGDKKPGLRGEHEGNRKTIRAGNAGMFRRTCGELTRMLFSFACEAVGARTHPAFPAPSVFEGEQTEHQDSDAIAPREGGGVSLFCCYEKGWTLIAGGALPLPLRERGRRPHPPASEPECLRSGSSSNGGGHILQSKLRARPGQTSPPPLHDGATGRTCCAAEERLHELFQPAFVC